MVAPLHLTCNALKISAQRSTPSRLTWRDNMKLVKPLSARWDFAKENATPDKLLVTYQWQRAKRSDDQTSRFTIVIARYSPSHVRVLALYHDSTRGGSRILRKGVPSLALHSAWRSRAAAREEVIREHAPPENFSNLGLKCCILEHVSTKRRPSTFLLIRASHNG